VSSREKYVPMKKNSLPEIRVNKTARVYRGFSRGRLPTARMPGRAGPGLAGSRKESFYTAICRNAAPIEARSARDVPRNFMRYLRRDLTFLPAVLGLQQAALHRMARKLSHRVFLGHWPILQFVHWSLSMQLPSATKILPARKVLLLTLCGLTPSVPYL